MIISAPVIYKMKAEMKGGRDEQREGKMVTMKDDRDVHWLGSGAYFTIAYKCEMFYILKIEKF